MPAMPRREPGSFGFAEVYDVLYENDTAFRAAQLDFLGSVFGAPPARLLDAGCGTGGHLLALGAAGYSVVGLDIDLRMVQVARSKLREAGRPLTLVRGDLRILSFSGTFNGVLCLESPLAYLLADDDLAVALTGLHRSLRPGGLLVVDVFDYPATLGEAGVPAQTNLFLAPWGRVSVREVHTHDHRSGVWIMRQEFRVSRGRRVTRFAVEHRLRVRSAESYAAALERAGFSVVECRAAYPNSPSMLEHERRIILVAKADALSRQE